MAHRLPALSCDRDIAQDCWPDLSTQLFFTQSCRGAAAGGASLGLVHEVKPFALSVDLQEKVLFPLPLAVCF